MKAPDFKGMLKEDLRGIATQLLNSLAHLKKIGVIHCDLKPENIMFTDSLKNKVKIVDFGSACTEFKSGFHYVQSRFYRCPEIVMGLPYDNAVDMWSFGCILCELSTGRPIFPAQDENELLEFIKMRIGMPPLDMITTCRKRRQFFTQQNEIIRSRVSRLPANAGVRSYTIKDSLFCEADEDFINFIEVSCCSFSTLYVGMPYYRSKQANDA
jgi:dual specificity tyrosine-phosphorylation-regulated kinase 2/3/4